MFFNVCKDVGAVRVTAVHREPDNRWFEASLTSPEAAFLNEHARWRPSRAGLRSAGTGPGQMALQAERRQPLACCRDAFEVIPGEGAIQRANLWPRLASMKTRRPSG